MLILEFLATSSRDVEVNEDGIHYDYLC